MIDAKRLPIKAKKLIGPSCFARWREPSYGYRYQNLEYPLVLTHQYGEIFKVKGRVIITGAKGFEYVLKTNQKNYIKKNLLYKRLEAFFGKSLLVTNDEEWRHRRRIASHSFQHANVKNYVPAINELTQEMIQSWKDLNVTEINFFKYVSLLTLKIGLKIFCHYNPSPELLNSISLTTHFGNRHSVNSIILAPWFLTWNNILFYWKKYNMDHALLKIISARRNSTLEGKTENDLLQALVDAKQPESTVPITDLDALAELKTLLLTGHETTAGGLAWMFYLLALHPEYWERIEHELDSVLGGRSPSYEDLQHLRWLTAVYNESLRFYPPIWSIIRRNKEQDEIAGFNIPKGSLLFLSIYALHRNPDYWDCPNLFYPQRFLEENRRDQHPFSFLPFSLGPRTCIASHLGTIESLTIAANILQQFRFERVNSKKVLPQPFVSLQPKGGLHLKLKTRVSR